MNQEEWQKAGQSGQGQQSEDSADWTDAQVRAEETPAGALSHEQLLLTLEDAQDKADQYWNQLLLARAEVENSRRHSERDG